MARVGPERVREPLAVGRPREVLGAAVLAAVDHGAPRRCRRRRRAPRCDGCRSRPACPCGAARIAITRPMSHGSARVAPSFHACTRSSPVSSLTATTRRAVGEPLRRGDGARRRRMPQLAHRAFPQPEREELAAHVDARGCGPPDARRSRPGSRRAGDELARGLRAMRGHVGSAPCACCRLATDRTARCPRRTGRRCACRRSARGARRSRRGRCGAACRCRPAAPSRGCPRLRRRRGSTRDRRSTSGS